MDACYGALVAKVVDYHGMILLSTSTQEVHRESFFNKNAVLFNKDELLRVLKLCLVSSQSGMPLPTINIVGLSKDGLHTLSVRHLPTTYDNSIHFIDVTIQRAVQTYALNSYLRPRVFWWYLDDLELVIKAIEENYV